MHRSISLLLIAAGLLTAQNPDWRAITNMNTLTGLTRTGNALWAATEGGIYRYDIDNESVKRYTIVDGLRSVNIKSISATARGNILSGSADGYLQMITETGDVREVYRFEDIELSDLHSEQDTLWIAAGKGLAVLQYSSGNYSFFDYFVNFPKLIKETRAVMRFKDKIYLATDNGLYAASSRFLSVTLNDPQNWTRFGPDEGLPSASVTSLAVFNQKLWIGTPAGLAAMDGKQQIENISYYQGSAIGPMLGTSDTLYLAVDARLYKNTAAKINFANRPFSARITAMENPANQIWLGFIRKGLLNEQSNKRVLLDGPYDNPVRVILRDGNQNTWALAQKYKFFQPYSGLYRHDGTEWQYITWRAGNGANIWSRKSAAGAAYVDRYNTVWLGTWGGGITFFRDGAFGYMHSQTTDGIQTIRDGNEVREIPLSAPAPEYRGHFSGANNNVDDYEVITAFQEDSYGRLWIANAYAQNGNYLAVVPYNEQTRFPELDKSQWRYFGVSDNLRLSGDKGIAAMTIDDFGRVWLATHDQGVYILDYNNTLDDRSDDAVFRRNIDDNLAGNEVRALATDKDGVVWIGTTAGLSSFDGLNFYRHPGDGAEGVDGPIGNEISQIVVDDYNNKWVATSSGLSILRGQRSVFEPGAWVSFTTANSGLLDNNVHSVSIDPVTGEAWIGTESGISIYKGPFAEIRPDFKQVVAGPNPYIQDGGKTPFIIKRLKDNSTVKILSLNGRLVRELRAGSNDIEGGRAIWDGKDKNGNAVASGIYIFSAYTADGSATSGKIAVIKP